LVLLASTTNTLITERTKEVAVMRSLGGARRPLRRRLRRIALSIAAVGAVLGIPLGIVVANVVARIILTRFVGVTPGIAVSWTVMAASLAFALVGARLVAGRAARRVTKLPLAEMLRDREGTPFGGRWSDRLLARIPTGGLFERLALRAGAHRRARTIAVVMQLAVGVAAVITVASLGTSIAAFNEAELEPWNWQSSAQAVDPGLPFQASLADADDTVEAAIVDYGEVGDWEVSVFGLSPETVMLDHAVRQGEWLDGSRGVVVSAGFADNQGIEVGDTVEISLASGPYEYDVRGLHRSRSIDFYIPIEVLAADLGAEGRANTFWSTEPVEEFEMFLPGVIELVTLDELQAENVAARDIIGDVFWTIGLIVVGVALLGVSSAMAVNLYERRHELAVFQAIGGRKAQLRRVLVTELVPLAVVGSALGVVAGWYGAIAIIGFFETVNAVEIGTVFATSAVPLAVAGAIGAVALIGATAARQATKRSVGATLRGAA
ncbi:MAG: FtsX-like permease family protein, partial [Actinomycetia bacterium]|nr:FtsX-like permease family protein [Actinomycetes bacterium]